MNPCASVRSESLARPKSFRIRSGVEPRGAPFEARTDPSPLRGFVSTSSSFESNIENGLFRDSVSTAASLRRSRRHAPLPRPLLKHVSLSGIMLPRETSLLVESNPSTNPFQDRLGHEPLSRTMPSTEPLARLVGMNIFRRSYRSTFPFRGPCLLELSSFRGCSAFEPDANHFRGPHRERSFPFRETAPHESVSKLELLRSLARPILLESSLLPVPHRPLSRPIRPEAH